MPRVQTMDRDMRLTSARSMALTLHMVIPPRRLVLTTNLSLHMVMLPPPATPRVHSHSSMPIRGMVPDKDTHLELLNRTVDLSHRLHDLRIPNSSHRSSRNLNLSLSHNPSRSLNPNPKVISSNRIIPRRQKLHRWPNHKDKDSLDQSTLVHHTCMIRTPRTRIQTFKLGPNTMTKEAKIPLELSISSRCLE